MSERFTRVWRDAQEARAAAQTPELPLFAPSPAARLTNPETSHAAAQSMREQARVQRASIVACLRQYGPQTADELDARLNWRPTTAGRRMAELAKLGTVRTNGETRPTRSGRAAEVWDVTEAKAA